MSIRITPVRPSHADFAGEVSGIDISKPLPATDVRAIEDGMDRFGVLVFHGQPLDQDQQLDFARQFGPLDVGFSKLKAKTSSVHRFKSRELADISNVGPEGGVVARDHAKILNNVANQLWHSDSSFQRPKAKYSMLSAVTVPAEGGDTEYCDLRAAYDALPEKMKRQVSKLKAVHYALHSRLLLGDEGYTAEQRAMIPSVTWPLVQTDPRSGRKCLFVGAHTSEIVGMTLPEGRMMLMDLLEHAVQRQFVYTHKWRVGDLVIWDNPNTLHRGRHFDLSQPRELRRATTEETVMSIEARQMLEEESRRETQPA